MWWAVEPFERPIAHQLCASTCEGGPYGFLRKTMRVSVKAAIVACSTPGSLIHWRTTPIILVVCSKAKCPKCACTQSNEPRRCAPVTSVRSTQCYTCGSARTWGRGSVAALNLFARPCGREAQVARGWPGCDRRVGTHRVLRVKGRASHDLVTRKVECVVTAPRPARRA